MELLERGAFLSSLEGSLDAAAGGHGCMVLVGGEAGIGKTSLVRAFCERHGADARVLWGACDALRTPRPLGPLLDIAREAGGELAGLVAAEPARHRLFSAFLDLLGPAGRTPPVIAVVEDAHWADEATLDLLVFVGRGAGDGGGDLPRRRGRAGTPPGNGDRRPGDGALGAPHRAPGAVEGRRGHAGPP
jgi:predicted ATPase